MLCPLAALSPTIRAVFGRDQLFVLTLKDLRSWDLFWVVSGGLSGDAVGKGLKRSITWCWRGFWERRHNPARLLRAAPCSHTSNRRCPCLSAPLAPVSRIQEILGADLDHMLQPRKGIRDHLRQVHCLHLHWAEGRCWAGMGTSHCLSWPCAQLLLHRLCLSSPTAYHRPEAVDDGPVLEPKPELEVRFLGPGGGVLPAHMEPPWSQGDGLHHQALWRVWLNCWERTWSTCHTRLPCTGVLVSLSRTGCPRRRTDTEMIDRWMETH